MAEILYLLQLAVHVPHPWLAPGELVAIIFSINAECSGGAISKINRDKCLVPRDMARHVVGPEEKNSPTTPFLAKTAVL